MPVHSPGARMNVGGGTLARTNAWVDLDVVGTAYRAWRVERRAGSTNSVVREVVLIDRRGAARAAGRPRRDASVSVCTVGGR